MKKSFQHLHSQSAIQPDCNRYYVHPVCCTSLESRLFSQVYCYKSPVLIQVMQSFQPIHATVNATISSNAHARSKTTPIHIFSSHIVIRLLFALFRPFSTTSSTTSSLISLVTARLSVSLRFLLRIVRSSDGGTKRWMVR